jgi:hypothetical protein
MHLDYDYRINIKHTKNKYIMYKVQDYVSSLFKTKLLTQLYMKVDILPTHVNHLHDQIISPRE